MKGVGLCPPFFLHNKQKLNYIYTQQIKINTYMIKIKNKEYKFKFGFKALIMYENETGKSVSEIGENINMSTLVDIAYCGLKAAGENVTKDFVIDAIDEDFALMNVFTASIQEDMAALNNMGKEAKK
jgi:hypothetical protein